MTAKVFVSPKKTVLDPQGKAIHNALKGLGFSSVADVRQGKYFVLHLNNVDEKGARAEVERIAREVLTNPVIEEFSYEIEP